MHRSHTTLSLLGASSLLIAVLASPAAPGGVVVTRTGWIEGEVSLRRAGIEVAGKVVPWPNVLRFLEAGGHSVLSAPHAIQLHNGERFGVRVDGFRAGKLDAWSPHFGARTIDMADVVVVEFRPSATEWRGLAEEDDWPPGTLYHEVAERTGLDGATASAGRRMLARSREKQVPGVALWLDEQKIALESPFGVVRLPREGLIRYVLPLPGPRTTNAIPKDEVSLADGCRLQGRLEAQDGALELDHRLFGRLRFPTGAVRAIVRRDPSVVDLASVEPKSIEAFPLTSGPALHKGLARARGDLPAARRPGFVEGLVLEPRVVARWVVPEPARATRTFRARAHALSGTRGTVHLTVRVQNETVLERDVEPAGKPIVLEAALPHGEVVEVAADFGRPLRFPARVVLGDPHIITVSKEPESSRATDDAARPSGKDPASSAVEEPR